jgi:RsiW-degrading membrane proteinase PrsW (M82 family)
MNTVSLAALLISPAIALVLYLYFIFTQTKMLSGILLKSFLWGGVSSVLCIFASYFALKQGLKVSTDLFALIIYSFLIVGLTSELGKFVVLKLFILSHDAVHPPVYGMIATIMAALGYATFMGLVFVFNPFDINFPFASNMYLLAIGPANVGFGVVLGFFLGMVRFIDKPWVYNLSGLASAMFFAGLFCFCMVTRDFKLLSLFSFGSSIVAMVLIFRAIYFKP